jgi:hypothetical protein
VVEEAYLQADLVEEVVLALLALLGMAAHLHLEMAVQELHLLLRVHQ